MHMHRALCSAAGAAAVVLAASSANAQTISFVAILAGANEVPPHETTGTGLSQAILNTANGQLTVNTTFSGLLTNAIAAHIHPGAPGVNGPVLFPFDGVPNATSGTIPTQTFVLTEAQQAELIAGNMYVNVHSVTFPGGEIRGQLAVVPEPATLLLTTSGLLALGAVMRQRRKRSPLLG